MAGDNYRFAESKLLEIQIHVVANITCFEIHCITWYISFYLVYCCFLVSESD